MSELTDTQLVGVADLLTAQGVAVGGGLRARLIAGGRSNLTYLLADDQSCWVLRRPPTAGGTPSAHDVAREFRVTSALETAGIPVPRAVLLCENDHILGAPFTIVDFVEGTSLRTRSDLETLDGPLLASSLEHLVATLAALHAVDHEAVGLATFGRPDGYAARQLRRWSGQWAIVGTDTGTSTSGAAEALAERLRSSIPDQAHRSIVHGDYRSDNTLVDLADGGRVKAIVDWELSTIGDPVADVALMCAYRHPALDLILGFPSAWTSPRLPQADDIAATYERAGGVPLDHWRFHQGLAFYKLAVIAAGIDHRYRAGGTVGTGFDTAGDAVAQLIDAGLAILEAP